MNSKKTIKSAFESMMYIWGEPLEVKAAADIFNISIEDAEKYFLELQEEYEQEGRGIVIRQVNKAFQFVTRPENAEFIEKLCTPVKVKRLSQSALEVLAIIAYKQPVTKIEIEKIRGVKSDHAVNKLVEYNLVKELGRMDAPGRPILFGTTEEFLRCFGVQALDELPVLNPVQMEEFKEEAQEEIQLRLNV